MKPRYPIVALAAAIACLLALAPRPSSALVPVPGLDSLAPSSAEAPAEPRGASSAEPIPFTLLLQGTRSGADVEAILGGLRTAPEITSLSPSGASQGRLEYRGTFRGSAEDLATDVRSLAVDRFDVSVHDDPARGLILTLRKLRD